ncbi:hypothetical protein ADIWIN_1457 [Winogradskyella psychrotolerans RS-3]|uniref:Uncharacterized protein n=1 Tax=Winogradskyella psychrotolerans RS-3 TaxID=641526 RepID=S7VVL0_9FLAO|nr:hypothetical protein [Winogradskyella psychrotolerans]EPR73427.1 hypothetical protein ADIWIN_1457 [Winogradskyella psychrotolerans RS-3]
MENKNGNEKFIWRENDESSSTLLKYDLEASHWIRAFKSAERKHTSAPISETFGTIALVFELILNLILLIILSLTQLIRFLRK